MNQFHDTFLAEKNTACDFFYLCRLCSFFLPLVIRAFFADLALIHILFISLLCNVFLLP